MPLTKMSKQRGAIWAEDDQTQTRLGDNTDSVKLLRTREVNLVVNFARTLLSPGEFESQNPGRELWGSLRGTELGKRGN